jgi:hypothetical protein
VTSVLRGVTLVSAIVVAAAALICGWGYWRVSTRADVHVAVHDVALRTDRQRYGSIIAGELAFKDASGAAVATARIDESLGIVSMIHPIVGDCRPEERVGGEAWRDCYEMQSRWLISWVRDVRGARVTFNSCAIENVPVEIAESRGAWWLWWVPAPHLDNSPSTHFNLTLWVDSAQCRAAESVR